MSHFTVLVIGANPEDQLSPFQENNMGDCPEEYLKYKVWDKEGKKHFFNNKEEFEASGVMADVEEGEEPGYMENPNAKWDWYVLGGRWSGYFKLKSMSSGNLGQPGAFGNNAREGYVDQCRKDAIDFDGMRMEAADAAAKEYDLVSSKVDLSLPFESYHVILDLFNDSAEARKVYNEQELVKQFQNACREKEFQEQVGIFYEIEMYKVDRQEFINQAKAKVCVPYAVIKDDKWIAKGEMGWFGLSNEDMTQTEWNQQFQKLIDELPEDTLLSLYDCHI